MDQAFFDLVIRLHKMIDRIAGSPSAMITSPVDFKTVLLDTNVLEKHAYHYKVLYLPSLYDVRVLNTTWRFTVVVQPYTDPDNQVLESNGLVSGASACAVLNHTV